MAVFEDEFSLLSPINQFKKQKDFLNEVYKIAKEIKQIPSEQFRAEDYMKNN